MNALLTGLGVPQEVQALFNNSDCVFDFGDTSEHFGQGFHRVPTSQNVWTCVRDSVTDLVITHSAMESIAFITLNRQCFPILDNIAFVAIGNYPHNLQTGWIRHNFKNRKITLVFSNCILGKLADIKVAAGLRSLPLNLKLMPAGIQVQCKGQSQTFGQQSLSLHAFEKSFGLRFGFKTAKPKHHMTYLDQLIHHAN